MEQIASIEFTTKFKLNNIINMIITLILVFLIFLVLFCYKHKITEQFTCLAKHYYKNDDEYEPIEETLCSGMTDEECKDYKAECIISNIDDEKLSNENSEEIEKELEKMLGYCMKSTTDVIFDHKCINKELNKNRGRGTRGTRGNRGFLGRRKKTLDLYKIIMKKCEIKSNDKKYTLDPKCILFG